MRNLFLPRTAPLPQSRRREVFVGLEQLEDRAVPALFTSLTPQTPGGLDNNGCVATGDFNGDGNLDIVTTNYVSGTVTVMFGDGTGNFNNATNYSPAGSNQNVSFVAVGDLNGDGNLDFVTVQSSSVGETAGTYTVFLGDGKGNFTQEQPVSTGGDQASWVGIGDFNGDGIPDIAITNIGYDDEGAGTVTGQGMIVLAGTDGGNGKGTGDFSTPLFQSDPSDIGFIPTAAAIGDFNGDGALDIAAVYPGVPEDTGDPQPDGNVDIYLNNNDGSGGLTLESTFDSGGPLPISAVAADMNADGKTDLVIANAGDPDSSGAGTNISILSGDGTGSFPSSKSLTTDLTSNASAFAVAVGDLNEDGSPDIAAVNYGGTLTGSAGSFIDYLNNGSGSFTAENKYTDTSSGPKNPQYLAIGNFNNSGGPDVVTVGVNPHIRTFLNDGLTSTTTISPSSASINSGTSETFTATVTGTGTAPTGSVSFYDGTTKLGNGTISTVGTAQEATYTTSTLALGTHSVTAHYNGETTPAYYFVSTSSATTVTVTSGTNTPPTISSIANQTVNAGSTLGPISFTVGDAETPPASLTLSAASTNTGLIPVSAITFGGSGANRTVSIATTAATSGTSTITITVTDGGGLMATSQFTVTINGPPTIGTIANQSIGLSSSTGPIAFTVGDESPSTLSLSATSTNTSVIPLSAITFGGSGTARTVSVASNTTAGSSIITVTVTDNGGLMASTQFTVTVSGTSNQPPTIGTIANQTVNAGSTDGPINFTIGDESPSTVTLSAASSNGLLIPVSDISFGGSGASRTVSIATTADTSGTSTITVTATDNGGLTASTMFTITVNGPPTIGAIANQTVNAGSSSGSIPFTIGDESPSTVTLSATSSDGTLIPVSDISFGGSGTARTVNVATIADTSGSSLITVKVTDSGGLTATSQFTVTVNGPPTIGTIPNQTVNAGTSTGPVAFTIGDETPGTVILNASSSNPALIPVSDISFGGSGTSRNVTVTTAAGLSGTDTITVTATDSGGLTATTTFTVTLNAPPTIGTIAGSTISEDSSTGPIAFTVGDESPATLILSAASSDPSVIPVSAISFGGSGTARTVTVASGAVSGSSTITVTVTDNGGLTATSQFTVTVNAQAANTPPTISGLTDQSTTEAIPVGPLSFTIGDAETAAASLTLSATSSNAALMPVSAISFGGSGASRTLTVAPADAELGTSMITVTVTDGGGLTASESFVLTVKAVAPGRVQQFAVSSDAGQVSTVTLYNPNETVLFTSTPFGTSFTGGIRTAVADFNGDGVGDLVVGTGPGVATQVKVLDGKTGATLFTINPFESTFTGGVFVAAGDINGDGVPDLVITPDQGGGPRVRVFSGSGFKQLADFYGINDPNFRGGARASVGDINGDGFGDIVVSAGYGGGPRIAIFSGKTLASTGGPKITTDFFAFETALRNGTYVSVGDVDGDGFADLVVGAGPGGGPRVTVFSGKDLTDGSEVREKDFFAGDVNNRGGIRVAVKNLDGDADSDIIVGDGTGGGSEVTAYLGSALMATSDPPPAPDFNFDAYPSFKGGVFVG